VSPLSAAADDLPGDFSAFAVFAGDLVDFFTGG